MWDFAHVMPYFWQFDGADDRWLVAAVEAGMSLGDVPARLAQASGPDGTVWVVLGPESVRVNGSPLDAGIAVLRDRDELLFGGERGYFTTERLATIEIFSGAPSPVVCPRCRVEISPGTPVVRCPGCGVLHHQSEEYGCWLYSSRCAMCDYPTALDAGFRWTPEGL